MVRNELILGWSEAQGLLNPALSWETFRRIVGDTYALNLRRAGVQAQSLWIFITQMRRGDLVIVPHGGQFYLAEVDGEAYYIPPKVSEDRAYRRPVKWLNNYQPFLRKDASPQLRKALRAWQTCTRCDHLLPEVKKLVA